MRVMAAVNVPRRDFRGLQILIFRTNRGPVIETGGNALAASAPVLIQDEQLSAGRAAARVAVHPDEAGRNFHQTVQLRRNHIRVFAHADVNRLAAALERQKHLAGLQIALHGNGVRPLEILYGQSKRVRQISPRLQIFFDLQGNDFGIRRDVRCNLFPVLFQIPAERRIIVDVPVQDHADVRFQSRIRGENRRLRTDGGIVDRMTIFLGDGAYGSPSGVGNGGFVHRRLFGKQSKNAVPTDHLPQVGDIAAQFADHGKGFVCKRNVNSAAMTSGAG